MLRALILAYTWANHLAQSLFYYKVLNIPCNLLNIASKVKKRRVVSVTVVHARDPMVTGITQRHDGGLSHQFTSPGKRSNFEIQSTVSPECVSLLHHHEVKRL